MLELVVVYCHFKWYSIVSKRCTVAFGTGNLAAVMIDQALRKQDVSRG